MNYGRFSQKELNEAVTVLKQCSNPHLKESAVKVADFLENVLSSMKESGEDITDLINRNECIGSILWLKDNVLQALKEDDYEASEENLYEVLHQIDIEELQNREYGWEVIYDAISKACGNLKEVSDQETTEE